MKSFIFILLILSFSTSSWGSAYFGGTYGYSSYTSKETKEYKLNQKGPSYGAFFGVGKQFVGLEAYYQNFTTSGKIKHDGEKFDYMTNATVLGGALRFSFNAFYARLGFGRYKLRQKIDIEDSSSSAAADEIYKIQNEESKNGVLLGFGIHKRFNSCVTFMDYSRHQITGAGSYDTLSVGVSFVIPDRLFGVIKI